jgi:membrane-associated phospholipid phosphatase
MTTTLLELDILLFRSINQLADIGPLAWAAWYSTTSDFFRGGIIMSAYWWFWFVPEARETRRSKIVAALIGMLIALVITRMMAMGFPFRVRPINNMEIGAHMPPVPLETHVYESWSSFPSDNAAMFFALAAGLWRLSPLVGLAAAVFAAVWIALVRVLLSVHYPSDVIAGAAIGVTCALAAQRLTGTRVVTAILRFERCCPHAFYAGMFLATFEFASLFNDIRRIMRGSLLVLRKLAPESTHALGLFAVGAAVVLILAAALVIRRCLSRRG